MASTLGAMRIEWRLPPTLIRPFAGAGVALVLSAAMWWWLSAPVQQTQGELRITRNVSTAVPQTVTADVIGDVRRPGVVRLPAGARVVDAVAAAGGLVPRHPPVVNMARLVVDGEQIVVGAGSGLSAASVASSTDAAAKVNLNLATAEELDALPGIGPVIAKRILEYRNAHGDFTHTRDLLDVPGIGDSKFADLATAITVS